MQTDRQTGSAGLTKIYAFRANTQDDIATTTKNGGNKIQNVKLTIVIY